MERYPSVCSPSLTLMTVVVEKLATFLIRIRVPSVAVTSVSEISSGLDTNKYFPQ